MLKRLKRWIRGARARRLDASIERRHEQILALHRKAQRRRDAVRSGRERLTTF